MKGQLKLYNSLTKKKEIFQPINHPHVGMYVCGPTVYNNVHLGNVRTFISFDIIFRYLKFLNYKVKYIRNITDVGHLLDTGEDKMSEAAKLKNLDPMEVAQTYTNDFHHIMKIFNTLNPNIEPLATGHMPEQIEAVEILLENGYAYEKNGSVYFDVRKFNDKYHYGKLSGRVIDNLISETRSLDGTEDKDSPLDFAVWKKANPNHIMQWNSKWGKGFPGWHLECSVMSKKYLGKTFDIHGGGMDLKFPHHDCEIAQNRAIYPESEGGARYWLHTNMLTVNGQKMSKSLGNSFLPLELITGDHPLLDKGYDPMTIKFFMLQSHYSRTLDFSSQTLESSRKGYIKLTNALLVLEKLEWQEIYTESLDEALITSIQNICDDCFQSMNDDFNTALAVGHLFKLVKIINRLDNESLPMETMGKQYFELIRQTFRTFYYDLFGLKIKKNTDQNFLIETILEEYKLTKYEKNYQKIDEIRKKMKTQGIIIKDMKGKTDWAFEE